MAVVINEMEVTPAPTEDTKAPSPGGKPNAKPIDPREAERIVAKQIERKIRVRAH